VQNAVNASFSASSWMLAKTVSACVRLIPPPVRSEFDRGPERLWRRPLDIDQQSTAYAPLDRGSSEYSPFVDYRNQKRELNWWTFSCWNGQAGPGIVIYRSRQFAAAAERSWGRADRHGDKCAGSMPMVETARSLPPPCRYMP
jgi:hypothetical protein